MDTLLDLAKGPLFRFSFAILVLGLGRILFLTIMGYAKSYTEAGDRNVPLRPILKRTLDWILPHRRIFRMKPVFSIISVLFHAGLIIVPLFLFAHIALWKQGTGFGWPAITPLMADALTILTLATAAALVAFRIIDDTARAMSRAGDYLWLILLAIPFLSGFLCAHPLLSPISYKAMLLVHIFSAELIFLMAPFTKIAHCLVTPFSPLISDMGWRFPADLAERIEATLGKKGASL